MNLIFDKLNEKDLEDVALLYDAERPVITNREKMKKTFNLLKYNKDYFMITAKIDEEIVETAVEYYKSKDVNFEVVKELEDLDEEFCK